MNQNSNPTPASLNLLEMISRIDQVLREQKKTASKMSRELGFSSGLYSQWKQGKQSPSADRLYKIAVYLGTSVDYLVGLAPDKESVGLRREIMQTLNELPPQSLEKVRDFVLFIAAQSEKNTRN